MSIYKVYPGCRTTWRYFIGVPCCHVKNILIFHTCGGLDALKTCMESKLEEYIRVRRSGVVPCTSLKKFQAWQGKAGGPNCHSINPFWFICWCDKRLSPLL